MNNKRIFLGLVAIFALFIFLPGCAVDFAPYPPPGYVEDVYPSEEVYPGGVVVYPLDIFPYFWGGWYYYPFWTGTAWVYNRYNRPLSNWRGHPVRHFHRHGPPRGWHKDSHLHHRDPNIYKGPGTHYAPGIHQKPDGLHKGPPATHQGGGRSAPVFQAPQPKFVPRSAPPPSGKSSGSSGKHRREK